MNEQAPPRRKISSDWTAFYSIVFPTIWIILFGGISLSMGWPHGLIIAPVMIFGLLIWYVLSGRLRVVHVDDKFFYISNYRRHIRVPLSDVSKITENVLINIHPVTLHLSTPSPFGTRIRFMPQIWRVFFFASHPIVAELTELVAQAKAAGGQRA